ncbi:MAG: aromatase [Frankiaceae bacterium]|nr:aromatase [Frankiaceae bacterium]
MPARTENTVFVDADLDTTWRMTNDVENWPNLFTEYAAAEVLSRSGNTVRFRLTMFPDEQNRVWSWVSERVLDPETHRVVARRVETGPFEFMNISWYYEPEGTGTRMTWIQEFAMRPQAPLNDEQMADRINQNTPIQMAAIRAKVESVAGAAAGTS